jgi:hypothetical protein
MLTKNSEAAPRKGGSNVLGTHTHSTGPWWSQAPHLISVEQLDQLHHRVVRGARLVESIAVIADKAAAP